MNKARRTQLEKLADQFENGEIDADDLKSQLETICDEEDEYRENMPENMQSSDRYSDSEQASDQMGMAIDEIDVLNDLEDEEERGDKRAEVVSYIRDAAA